MPYNYNICSVIHRATWVVFSIEITRASILFFSRILNFFWFLLYYNFVSENFNFLLCGENLSRVWESLSQPREKKNIDPNRPSRMLLLSAPLLYICEPFTDTDRICRSDRNVLFHFTKLFFLGPLICILPTSTITKLAKFQTGIFVEWEARKVPTERLWPNGSPCFVKKCVKRCLFQESSGRRVTLLLETNFLHISGA